MASDRFIVLIGSIIGNPTDGYRTVYDWDETAFHRRADAIKSGWEQRESDDFNIGVVRGGRLVDLAWMEEGGKADASELRDIEQQITLIAQEATDA